MNNLGDHVLVTGGAGFIGSHLVDRLADAGHRVTVVDDLSGGTHEWLPEGTTLVEGDLTERAVVERALTEDVDFVFHLAASKRVDTDRPREQFERNSEMTYNVLERMDEVGVERLGYTSSSTVYGDAPRPTPEDYAPLHPISVYGASKLADEGLISTYAHSHGLRAWTFRFANIVGPRLRGAVIPDFIEKLRADPETLEILGNGRQEKSFMHVSDCIDAMAYAIGHADRPMNVHNLGTRTTTSVTSIADIVADAMGLDPTYEYTGGDRGWTGDVPKMCLSIQKLAVLGYEPELSSDEAVRRAAEELLEGIANDRDVPQAVSEPPRSDG
ncbi:NAD-dependent epimerase/dehydratase family protein [Natronorarus salvus]|uniref:NAD-dependent epimerase/dehydratase family protein n=1 Tax=Natronorarus salvus TaxID=3117733 RepID=UPI002F262480